MFKLDMDALRKEADIPITSELEQPLAKLAALAISQPANEESFDLLGARLMAAAMRRCDEFNDSEQARQDMREQILETPPHLREDLLDYFMSRPATLH